MEHPLKDDYEAWLEDQKENPVVIRTSGIKCSENWLQNIYETPLEKRGREFRGACVCFAKELEAGFTPVTKLCRRILDVAEEYLTNRGRGH